jgi:hypothetical protein
MTPAQLLGELRARGAVVTAQDGRLRITAPAGTVTPDLRRTLETQKPALLELLTQADASRTATSPQAAQPFRYRDHDMEFGDICVGWTPWNWATELRRKAERCRTYRADVADDYERWAADIEQRLGKAAS